MHWLNLSDTIDAGKDEPVIAWRVFVWRSCVEVECSCPEATSLASRRIEEGLGACHKENLEW
jgi:hypothetical protein